MGSSNNRNRNLVNDQNQALIQQDNVDISLFVDQPEIKKVYAIKNPIYIKKLSFKLERDFKQKDKYYISFNYDALVDFDLYVNFNVCKKNKKIIINNYAPLYPPSKDFEKYSVHVPNVAKGENVEFLNKDVFVTLPEYMDLKSGESKDTNAYDICLEIVPKIEAEVNGKDTEIRVVSLCEITKEENEEHNYKIKLEKQQLNSQGLLIDLIDIFHMGLDSGECNICCSDLSNTVFLPCMHLGTCSGCAHSLRMRNNPCPFCKSDIEELLILESEEGEAKRQEVNAGIENSASNELIAENIQ